jgi:hypothetical protein
MSFVLNGLGMQFTSNGQSYATTFNDMARLQHDSPLRRAWSYAEPTFAGMLAASLRLLRDPYVVYTLTSAPAGEYASPLTYFSRLYADCVAAVFGDTATIRKIQERPEGYRRRTVLAAEQPTWLTRHLGEQHDILLHDERLTGTRLDAVIAAVTSAQEEYGVLRPSWSNRYCEDAEESIGWAAKVSLPTRNLSELHEQGRAYNGITLMNREALAEAGVPVLLHDMLNAELAPGVTVWNLSPLFLPLMWADDREALQLNFTLADQERFDDLKTTYARRAANHRAALAVGNTTLNGSSDTLGDDDFFTASRGRVVYN